MLIYYAITNLAALQLPREARLYPRGFAIGGLLGCVFLAFWVPPPVWGVGLGLIGLGLVWHWTVPKLRGRQRVRETPEQP